MSGFLLNLKNKVAKPKNGKKVSLKKVAVKSNLLLAEEEDVPQKVIIDAYNSGGALNGSKLVNQKDNLVIVPANLSTGLLKNRSTQINENEDIQDDEADIDKNARDSLLKGEVVENPGNLVLNVSKNSASVLENTEEDYENVPVEEFGAALLRGMGWDGKMAKGGSTDLTHRQKGLVLGIGSKPVGKELEQELMMKRGTKLSVPLIRKEKESGK
ncbi:CIC11C00000001450 [Sungouiella intermedia]|uniref:Pre-mRNA-splicing factor n=1 Tax=Sungouiella intermedia TaxID=45354 RepID=A0A1L0FVZ1_9ASCO|nr:CIC11C00000001450 [[Candida] intermedia]